MKEKVSRSPAKLIAIIFGVLWLLSINVLARSIVLATNFFRGMVDSISFGKSDPFAVLEAGSASVGFLEQNNEPI